jgi:hypothetical protein
MTQGLALPQTTSEYELEGTMMSIPLKDELKVDVESNAALSIDSSDLGATSRGTADRP